MQRNARRGYIYALAALAGTSAAGLVGAGFLNANATATAVGLAGAAMADGARPRIHPTLKYLGNAGCMGSGCHSGEAKEQSGQQIGDECTIWEEKDPHHKAYASLSNDLSKKIADTLKLGDATKADRCLTCHATNAPESQRGDKFKELASTAVGCESCHGPGEKYASPHAKAGWTAQQRQKGAAAMESEWGLIDTSDLTVRTGVCVSCHLKIDGDLVEAGHPPLVFELYYYNNYEFKDEYGLHWDEAEDPQLPARMWAIGQVIAASQAEAQAAEWKAKGWKTDQADALAKLFGAGKGIVSAQFGTADAAALRTAAMPKDKIIAAAQALAGQADAVKSGEVNKASREIIAAGMEALVSAAAGEPGDDFFAAAEIAHSKDGDAWAEAVKKMASFAK